MRHSQLFFFVYTLLLSSFGTLHAQHLDTLKGKPGVSLRGLSVVNDHLLWVSGNKGTVGRSTNGGKSFTWLPVKGYESRDFRDIEAFDAATAVILAVDSPGILLRTHDGGATWQEVYRDNRPGIFLDALSFWKDRVGMAIGDPINGKVLLLKSSDAGQSWQALDVQVLPVPENGEACFAASGSNIQLTSAKDFAFITGGQRSRLFRGWSWQELPVLQNKETGGANALALLRAGKKKNPSRWMVVGGDFTSDTSRTGNAALSTDGGRTWRLPKNPPQGYRSGLVFISRKKLICCGLTGVDISADGGNTWKNISVTGYHACQRAKDGKAVYLAGGNGRIARLRW